MEGVNPNEVLTPVFDENDRLVWIPVIDYYLGKTAVQGEIILP